MDIRMRRRSTHAPHGLYFSAPDFSAQFIAAPRFIHGPLFARPKVIWMDSSTEKYNCAERPSDSWIFPCSIRVHPWLDSTERNVCSTCASLLGRPQEYNSTYHIPNEDTRRFLLSERRSFEDSAFRNHIGSYS